jgi:hypothetical protein
LRSFKTITFGGGGEEQGRRERIRRSGGGEDENESGGDLIWLHQWADEDGLYPKEEAITAFRRLV